MVFYVIEIITDVNDGIARNITPVYDYDNARMLFHQILASAYANTQVVKDALVMIVDDHGNTINKEDFHRVISES